MYNFIELSLRSIYVIKDLNSITIKLLCVHLQLKDNVHLFHRSCY